MAHRLAPEAEAELDDIWHYLATERGAISPALEIAPFFSAELL
jgi:plasmid stabilization system protein ParE